jgi:hypothetical protein
MQTAGRLDDAAHLAGLQAKGRDLELLLHVALAEVAQVAALAGRRAVGLGEGELAEGDAAGVDLGLVGLDDGEGLVFRARDLGLLIPTVSSHPLYSVSHFTASSQYQARLNRREGYLVGLTSRQLDGRRESRCLTSRCAARILPSGTPGAAPGREPAEWWAAM